MQATCSLSSDAQYLSARRRDRFVYFLNFTCLGGLCLRDIEKAGRDVGMLVRTKLNELLELMNNEQHLAEERAKAVAEREKHERVQAQARSLQARVAASQGRPLTGAGVVSVVLVLIGHLSCPVVYELFPPLEPNTSPRSALELECTAADGASVPSGDQTGGQCCLL